MRMIRNCQYKQLVTEDGGLNDIISVYRSFQDLRQVLPAMACVNIHVLDAHYVLLFLETFKSEVELHLCFSF